MKPRVSRRVIAVLLVFVLANIIATSVIAMGLALREAQQSSRQEELRRMGCDIVDVDLASRAITESNDKTSLAMYRSVGLTPAFSGRSSVTDIMMQSFLWAGEFPQAIGSVPRANATKAVGATATFSAADLEAMQRIPGVRDVWVGVGRVQFVPLDIGGTPQNIISLPMRQGQLALWNFVIERGRDFAPGDGPDAAIIGRTLADLLFPSGDPVGRTIVGTDTVHVIGVLALREPSVAASSGAISPYSNPNSSIFRAPAVPSQPRGEAQLLQLLTEPGTGPAVASVVQRTFRSAKENADTILKTTSRNSIVVSIVGIAVRTQTLKLVLTYALFTLLGCILAVGVSLYTEFATRVRAVAIHRALGASRRSIAGGFMAEAAVVAGASWTGSTVLLIVAQQPWERLLRALLQSGVMDVLNRARSSTVIDAGATGYLDVPFRLSAGACLPSFALLLLVAGVASLVPALGISHINPSAGMRFRGGVRSRFDALKVDLWGSLAVALCLLVALLALSELSFGLKRDREFSLLLGRDVARISTSQTAPMTSQQLQLVKEKLSQAGHRVVELKNVQISWTSADGDPHQWIRVLSGDAALPGFYGLTPVEGRQLGVMTEDVELDAFVGPDVWKLLNKTPNLAGGNLGSMFLSNGAVEIGGQFGSTDSLTMNRTVFTTLDTRTSMCATCGTRTTLLVGGVKPGSLQEVQDIVRSCVPAVIYTYLGFLDGGALVAAMDGSTQALAGFLILFALFGLLEAFIVFVDQLYLYAQLKTRDTAIRKALGMSQAQLTRLHLTHNVLIAGISVIVGALLMVLVAVATERPSSALTSTSLPWLVATCLLAFIVSLVAARNQARRSRGVVPSRELRNL
jgi:ABC-type antimicrobial peptide transport system permease subunit